MTNKEFDLKFEKLRKKSFAIYCVLADILAKENPDHVPSRIDQLTGEYLAENADMWQGYKLKNNRIAELEEDNKKLKIALELVVSEYIDFKQSLVEDCTIEGFIFTDIDFVKQSFIKDTLEEAKKYLKGVKNGKF